MEGEGFFPRYYFAVVLPSHKWNFFYFSIGKTAEEQDWNPIKRRFGGEGLLPDERRARANPCRKGKFISGKKILSLNHVKVLYANCTKWCQRHVCC